jgi:formyltetrahydrofolate deformylase
VDLARLLISCPDRPGISAAVSGFLFEHGANITDLQQFSTDPSNGQFFMRIEFVLADLATRSPELNDGFARLAGSLQMQFRLAPAAQRKRLAIMASKADHALHELLSRRQSGDLAADIRLVVSNHRDVESLVASYGIPFHCIPVTPETKAAAEAELLELLVGAVDTVVLARYMQVMSPRFLAAFPNQAIESITGSRWPTFAGPGATSSGRCWRGP